MCSPFNLELCDAESKSKLEGYMKLELAELDETIKAEEGKLEEANTAFQDAVAELQKQYQKLSEEKDAKLAEVQKSGLGLLKAVRAAKMKESAKDEL